MIYTIRKSTTQFLHTRDDGNGNTDIASLFKTTYSYLYNGESTPVHKVG